jgi:hypothetical protein
VMWHADDYTYQWASAATTALRRYLAGGGRLLLAGWELVDNLLGERSSYEFEPGHFAHDWLKISAMELSQSPDTFAGAVGTNGYPGIEVDSAKVPLPQWHGTLRYIEALTPVPPAEAIYTIDLRNNGSPFEGRSCGIRYLGPDYKLVLLSYPLYFMKQDQARALVVKVMTEFGEVAAVAGRPVASPVTNSFQLSPARPNPFKQWTTINYQIPALGMVELAVYNIAGQKVRMLVSGMQPAGSHTVRWDGRDRSGKPVTTGVYVYKLISSDASFVRKMLLMR